jgi:hypothetical protein
MSLILKNRTRFNSLYELDKSCFEKANDAYKTYGVLGGTVAALKADGSYTVVPADGKLEPIGLFVNNAAGNPFDNAPAVASNKIAIAQAMASVEVDVYADVEFKIGDKLYADDNGYLTNVEGENKTVIGIVTKLPTTADPFLGLEMRI